MKPADLNLVAKIVEEALAYARQPRLDIRFRGQFCYIDAYTEPELPGPNWPPVNFWVHPKRRSESRPRCTCVEEPSRGVGREA